MVTLPPNSPQNPFIKGPTGSSGHPPAPAADSRAAAGETGAAERASPAKERCPTFNRLVARSAEWYTALLHAATSSTESPLALHQAALVEVDDLHTHMRTLLNNPDQEAVPERLSEQLKRAVCAAADIGLHALRWSTTQTETFLRTYAPPSGSLSVQQIQTKPSRHVASWHRERVSNEGASAAEREHAAQTTVDAPRIPAPPPARKAPAVLFSGDDGACVIDPYPWLDTRSPKVDAFVSDRVAYTEQFLLNLPGSQRLQQRLEQAKECAPPAITKLQRQGDICFYLRQASTDNFPVLCQRQLLPDGTWGEERELFNPTDEQWEDLPGKEIFQYKPTSDGRLIMLRVAGDNEIAVSRYLDTTSGALRPDKIERLWGGDAALLDDECLVATQLPEMPADTPPSQTRLGAYLVRHKIGTPPESDLPIFGPGVHQNIHVAPNETPRLEVHGDFVIARSNTANTRAELIIHCASRSDVTNAQCAEDISWRKIAGVEDGVRAYAIKGDHIYLATYRGPDGSTTPRYRVVRVPLKASDRAENVKRISEAEQVLAQQPDVIVGLHATQTALYVNTYLPNGGRLLCFTSENQSEPDEIELPFKGFIAEAHADRDHPDLTFKFQSPVEAPLVYTHRPGEPVTDTGLQLPYPKSFRHLSWKIHLATDEDGTEVPVSVVHNPKKQLASQMEAYAAYDAHPLFYGKSGPHPRCFDPQVLEQIETFGLVDMHAFVVGGGTLGHDWHLQGLGTNKPIAGRQLRKITQKLKKLGIPKPVVELVSAGGRHAPTVLAHPDEFAGLLGDVAVYSGLLEDPIAPFNIDEAGGTPETAQGFNNLLRNHLYPQRLPIGPYLPTLAVTGLSDARVSAGQTLKTVALAEARNTGNAPILLYATDGGHIIADHKRRDVRTAIKQSFVYWASGHPEFQPSE